MLTRKKVIGCKQEATQNTAIALAAGDFFYADSIDMNPSMEVLEKLWASSSLDPFPAGRGKLQYNPKFKTDIKPSGVLATPPVIGPLLQTLGLLETIVGGVSVTYAPVSAPASVNYLGPGKSVTIKSYHDGILHIAAGCMGNAKMTWEPNKVPVADWDLHGIFAPVTDATFPTNTPDSTDPPIVKSIGLVLHTYSPVVHKLELDFGNKVELMDDANAANGIFGFKITDRKPIATILVDAVTVATHDFYGKVSSGVTGSLSFAINNGAGKISTLTMSKVQYASIKETDINGSVGFEVQLAVVRNAGDDWLSWPWT